MRIKTSALLISTLALTACGFSESRVNPVNWFGRGAPAPVAAPAVETNALIPTRTGLFSSNSDDDVYQGRPIDSISDLVVERVPGGAIIRVTGVAATQGEHSVRLTPANDDEAAVDGVLVYRLEALPSSTSRQGSAASREIHAARKVTDQTLAGARTIRVEAARNALQARR
ncbi:MULTISPECIES: hypothetical protein [Roseobacteraceae]|uniref:hypothetical protein n=1 Tax=Roseobacteraceae TaxID=2854170 RepID=UPI003298CC75